MRTADQVDERESIIGILRPPPVVGHGRKRSDKFPWVGVIVLSLAIIGLLSAKSLIPTNLARHVPFELQVTDVAGKMHVRWNAAAEDLARAESAILEVTDGRKGYRYPITRGVLKNGGVEYTRRTDDVEATLVLYKDGEEIERRMVRSISAPTRR